MKKLFFLFASAILMMSCSSDDNSSSNPIEEPEPTTATFIKSVTVNSPDSDGMDNIRTILFEYDEDKKVKKMVHSDNSYDEFEYLNDKIDKWKFFNSSGTLEGVSTFTYQNDGKVQYGLIAEDGGEINSERIEFSYNSNNQLTKWVNCGVPGGCESTTMFTSDSFEYSGNNISKVIEGGFWQGEITHQYDTKPNPFKNYDFNFKTIIIKSFALPVNENNIIKSIRTEPFEDTINYVVTYYENGFPKTMIGTKSNGNLYVSYDYEYVEL